MKLKSPSSMTKKQALEHEIFLKEQLQKTQARLIELQSEENFEVHSIDWEKLLKFGGENHSTIYADQQKVLNILSPVGFTGSYNTTNRQWVLRVSMDSEYLLVPLVKAFIVSALPYMRETEDVHGAAKVFTIDYSDDGNGKLHSTLDIHDNGTCKISHYFRHELDSTDSFDDLESALYHLPVNTMRDRFYRSPEYHDLVGKYVRKALSEPTAPITIPQKP